MQKMEGVWGPATRAVGRPAGFSVPRVHALGDSGSNGSRVRLVIGVSVY